MVGGGSCDGEEVILPGVCWMITGAESGFTSWDYSEPLMDVRL